MRKKKCAIDTDDLSFRKIVLSKTLPLYHFYTLRMIQHFEHKNVRFVDLEKTRPVVERWRMIFICIYIGIVTNNFKKKQF